jgi:hypothetical protein
MNAQWLLSWWNLIFIVPFGLALVYLGVYTLSGWTFGDADADADADVDHDVDVDVDHDVDVDADADVDHDIEADADADADTDHDADTEHDTDASGGGSPLWAALSFLGVGKVPVSIVLMILLLSWGVIGFGANQLMREKATAAWQLPVVSVPIAAIASLLITSTTSRAINRFMPLNVTSAKRRHELLGSTGEVILPIDAKFGLASVRDSDSGDLYQVPCRLENSGNTIPKGARVKLVAYDARESLFYVLPAASNN